MHAGNFEILIPALLIIPTCFGLWRDGRANRHGAIQDLLERRRANRRLGRRPLHDPRANYHYLGLVPPGQAMAHPLSHGYERRSADRRIEDAAYQSSPLQPRLSPGREFGTGKTMNKIDLSELDAAAFQAKHTSPQRKPGNIKQA